MSDAALRALAAQAGILVEWRDAAGEPKTVSPETLRQMLAALDLPCRTVGDLAESRRRLQRQAAEPPALLAVEAGMPIPLPPLARGATAELESQSGKARSLKPRERGGRWELPPVAAPGYYRLRVGRHERTIAIAPPRCYAVADISRRPIWGIAAQIYGLRRDGDGGIGDVGGVVDLARAAAPFGCDAVALSPIHALFGAHPERFAPYSPSSRSFLNPLHADPALVLGARLVKEAHAKAGIRGEDGPSIDWPSRAAEKHALFRALYAAMPRAGGRAADFARYRDEQGAALKRHAQFEARGAAPADRAREARYHMFLQWLARRGLEAAQQAVRAAGMRVGLITDLAVGADPGGSDAWCRRGDMLNGLAIGAPPDLFNPRGQNWGLAAFSPRAFAANGYAPFLDMLRAGMAAAGGIRIDHAMGLRRLWLVPEGASPADGAYVAYPLDDLLRLIALESARHRAIVIAEDLGTVPPGFSGRLNRAGILGMRVLWFERDGARFLPPDKWRRAATAMTSTHDLPTVAGWWRGGDIATKARLGVFDRPRDAAAARQERAGDRAELWRALRAAGVARGTRPAPREANPAVDAALRFVARTPSRLALIPLEDLVGEPAQPNLPGTIDEHPNWRRRQKADAATLLAAPKVAARLSALQKERGR